jgi:hypothetical protein
MLYDFKTPKKSKHSKTLCQFLDDANYAQVTGTVFKVIRKDLTQEEQAGNISYRNDGIYLVSNGQEYKGYIYLKYKVQIHKYGYPKFHITKCSTLETAIQNGDFLNRYYWHNSNTVSIEDRPSGVIHKDINLELCGYCRSYNSPSSTQEFYNELEEENEDINQQQNIEVDIFGYVREWQRISQNYKAKKGYTCEKCKIQMSGIDKRYIHTDHKNGDKTRNIESNFECLCILCHCYKDELHRENFGKRRMKRELKSFADKFRKDLLNLNNQYLKQYDKDNS